MARDVDDMSGTAARDGGERDAAKRARDAALGADNAPSAAAIGEAVAKALERVAQQPPSVQKLGPVVRASVRCGYEDKTIDLPDGSRRIVTMSRKVTFTRDETADGREYTLERGQPIHLKREAFIKRRDEGVVLIAE